MITTILQLSTYLLAIYIVFLSISKPSKGLLLYLATQTTRLYNFQNIPRLLSPQTFDLIILLILLYRFGRYINVIESIKSSKIFFLWVISHIIIRIIQINVYPDMSFVQVTSDIIGFYFKLYILFLIILGYLNRTNKFSVLNTALLTNLIIYCGFIFLEYFYGINYNDLYKTIFGGEEIKLISYQREGLSLIPGPNVHWVSTGTYLVSSFSIILYNYKKNINYKSLAILGIFLLTIFLVGARSAIVAAIITIVVYFIMDFKKNNRMKSILIFTILFIVFLLSPYVEFIINSFSFSENEGINIYRRIIIQLLMIEHIKDVPLIGYGFVGRHDLMHIHETVLFQFQDYPELNVIITEIFDSGIIIALITTIFILVALRKTISIKYSWCNVATYSWIAVILCFISNGNQEYNYYVIPVIFYTYAVWFKKGVHNTQVVSI